MPIKNMTHEPVRPGVIRLREALIHQARSGIGHLDAGKPPMGMTPVQWCVSMAAVDNTLYGYRTSGDLQAAARFAHDNARNQQYGIANQGELALVVNVGVQMALTALNAAQQSHPPIRG